MKGFGLALALVAFATSALADTDAIIVARREFEAVDFSIGPELPTVGEYVRRYPPASDLRLPSIPTQRMAEYTVVTTEGKRLKITQKVAAGLDLGAHVTIIEANGSQRLVVR